jgi:hypothetical protein
LQEYENGSLSLTAVGPLGPYANNAYVFADRAAGEAIVVDMPAQSQRTLEAVGSLRVVAVLLTHTHPDHWAEYDVVKAATGAPVFCHPEERLMPAGKIDRPLADGDHLAAGRNDITVVHTRAHAGELLLPVGRYLISETPRRLTHKQPQELHDHRSIRAPAPPDDRWSSPATARGRRSAAPARTPVPAVPGTSHGPAAFTRESGGSHPDCRGWGGGRAWRTV